MIAPLFFDRPQAPSPRWVRIATVLVLAAALAAICWGLLAASTSNWSAIWRYRAVFWQGWLLTIGISLAALALSTAAGVLLALARRSTFLPLRSLALLYIELIRGSPLLVQILFFWYVVADHFNITDRLLVGTLVLSGFSSAYLAEMIRSGIESVGASQLESARAIGLSPFQTYRFVIFPQAIRQVLPSLAGQFASLIKDSSLLSVIGLPEFTQGALQVNSATYSTLESFVPLGIGYLILTLPISALSRLLERQFHYES
ncbi:MAG: amino acid ABC transporter permease [Terrimicrobiaceae bacterium]|nr:amino acid ABC transporter permease [Terrimicrobiaceae bacterium]